MVPTKLNNHSLFHLGSTRGVGFVCSVLTEQKHSSEHTPSNAAALVPLYRRYFRFYFLQCKVVPSSCTRRSKLLVWWRERELQGSRAKISAEIQAFNKKTSVSQHPEIIVNFVKGQNVSWNFITFFVITPTFRKVKFCNDFSSWSCSISGISPELWIWNSAVTFPPGTVLSLGYHQSLGFEATAAESAFSLTLKMLQHLLQFQKLPFLGSALFPPSTQAHVRLWVKQMLSFLTFAQNEGWVKQDCDNPWAIGAVILGDSLGQKWFVTDWVCWGQEVSGMWRNLGSSSDSSWSCHGPANSLNPTHGISVLW